MSKENNQKTIKKIDFFLLINLGYLARYLKPT